MFNFFVVWVDLDMGTDPGRANTWRRNFKSPALQTKGTKKEVPLENKGFNGISLKFSDEKI